MVPAVGAVAQGGGELPREHQQQAKAVICKVFSDQPLFACQHNIAGDKLRVKEHVHAG